MPLLIFNVKKTHMQLSPNDQTIEVYNRTVDLYLQGTPGHYLPHHAPMRHWIEVSLAFKPNNGKILEIGSGPGRDAHFMKSLGHEVLCSDASSAFVDYLRQSGHEAVLLNALKDPIPSHAMIFANAVTPHFTQEELYSVLTKIYTCLPHDGIFAFSVKQGEGEAWIDEKLTEKRFVHYWHPTNIKRFVESIGFNVVFFAKDIQGDFPQHIWTLITVRKIKK